MGLGCMMLLLNPRESIKLCLKKDVLINEIDVRDQNISPHSYKYQFLRKRPKIYIGEKIASSTNRAVQTG